MAFREVTMPRPKVADGTSERKDLEYSEEVMSRAQAVTSLARIGSRRQDLADRVILDLIEIAQSIPGISHRRLSRHAAWNQVGVTDLVVDINSAQVALARSGIGGKTVGKSLKMRTQRTDLGNRILHVPNTELPR